MFSNNDQISARQIKRLLLFDLFGASSLLLPAQLAKAGTGIGLWSLLTGIGLAGLYLWILYSCFRRAPQDYMIYLSQGWGNFLTKVFFLCYAGISVTACAWAAKLLSEVMCESLLENRDFAVALLLILMLALYGGIAGLEARARIYELLFWVLVIPLLVMLLLCIRQVQVIQWFPLSGRAGSDGAGLFWRGAWMSFASFLPLTFLLFLVPHVQSKKKAGKAAAAAFLISGTALVAIYLLLLGIFGQGALAREEYAIITLLGMIKIPGDFVKRLDAVMVGVWFFTLYALTGTALYYGVTILRKAVTGRSEKGSAKSRRQMRVQRRWFFAVTVFVYGMAYLFHVFPDTERIACRMLYTVGIPFLILLPAISVFLCPNRKIKRRRDEMQEHA